MKQAQILLAFLNVVSKITWRSMIRYCKQSVTTSDFWQSYAKNCWESFNYILILIMHFSDD